jgi:membrane-associated protease RseP (regulator of RpoE activity)
VNTDGRTWIGLPDRTRRDRVWLHVLLFLLTVLSTTFIGGFQYLAFVGDFTALETGAFTSARFSWITFLLNGLWYAGTVLAILGLHELGHYAACRFYGVDATLPYFLPAPPPLLTGTFGAFIRIRSRIPSKVALFDIAVAGPLAGFAVAVPALVGGLLLSRVARLPADFEGAWLGEPLLFRLASFLIFGDVADGYAINLHPVGFAAWFGLLATALNLFPVSQLDGGHISYAVLGRRSSWITILMLPATIALTVLSWSWLLWTALLILMVAVVGPHHPPTLDDEMPLGRGRLFLAGFALLMLVLCFTPAPIEPFIAGGR